MTTDSLKGVTCPSVIRIPGLVGSGVVLPQLSDEGEDPQPTCHHIHWISLGDYLLNVEEVTCIISQMITSVDQWRYQLNANHAPLGHSCRTSHIMDMRFSSLNSLQASLMRNIQSSS